MVDKLNNIVQKYNLEDGDTVIVGELFATIWKEINDTIKSEYGLTLSSKSFTTTKDDTRKWFIDVLSNKGFETQYINSPSLFYDDITITGVDKDNTESYPFFMTLYSPALNFLVLIANKDVLRYYAPDKATVYERGEHRKSILMYTIDKLMDDGEIRSLKIFSKYLERGRDEIYDTPLCFEL